MDDRAALEETPAQESHHDTAFTVLCVLLLVAGLGFMMYRVASLPRQLAVDLPEHRVAPPGTYFAREYVAMTTDRGVIGLPPGTAVFVRQKGNPDWIVNDGIDDIKLKPASLTIDTELAANLRAHDAEAQSRAAASQARAEAMYQSYLAKKRVAEQAEMDGARKRLGGSAPIGAGTSLDQPAQPAPGGVSAYGGGYGTAGGPAGPSYYNYQTQQWIGAH